MLFKTKHNIKVKMPQLQKDEFLTFQAFGLGPLKTTTEDYVAAFEFRTGDGNKLVDTFALFWLHSTYL